MAKVQSLEEILTIELFGESYRFTTDSTTEEARAIVESIVEEVDRAKKKMKDPLTESRKFILLLSAALNIAKELSEVKKSQAELQDTLQKKSATLIEKLGEYQALR
ncbi:MAG: cell division protein ZapA [Desulfobacterales bacterium]|nr:cell division protein ZapA [Desulfobacterales bacterium]